MEADPIRDGFYEAIGRLTLLATRLDCVSVVAAANIRGDGRYAQLMRAGQDAWRFEGALDMAIAEARQGGWFRANVLDQYENWAMAVRAARRAWEQITYDPVALLEDQRDWPDAYLRVESISEVLVPVRLTELGSLAARLEDLARAGYDEFLPFPNPKRVLAIPAPRRGGGAGTTIDLTDAAVAERRRWLSWRGR